MGLSKVFGGISHDLIIAKLAADGVSLSDLKLTLSHLSDRQQCVKINNIDSNFIKIISPVPQGSILRPILFNLSINDLFSFIEKASNHNLANDNSLSAWAQYVSDLIAILESEGRVLIDWFTKNKMIVNSGKFQAIVLDEKKS